MEKPTFTAQQIHAEVQKQIQQIQEVIEDNVQIKISIPYGHERDEYGCNWNISSINNGSSYLDAIKRIIFNYRLKVDIIE